MINLRQSAIGVLEVSYFANTVVVVDQALKAAQVELSGTDCLKLGIDAPVRTSGQLSGTPGITVKGPAGVLELSAGLIIADRHIHMTPEDARWFGVEDGERVSVRVGGPRGGLMGQVVIRVSEKGRCFYRFEGIFH